jgi:hypothetical protein
MSSTADVEKQQEKQEFIARLDDLKDEPELAIRLFTNNTREDVKIEVFNMLESADSLRARLADEINPASLMISSAGLLKAFRDKIGAKTFASLVNSPGNGADLAPAFAAVTGNRIDSLEFLVANGANLHQKDSKGENLLHAAVSVHNPGGNRDLTEMVENLIELGVKLDEKNNEGKTPLDLAREAGHADLAATLETAMKAAQAEKARLEAEAKAQAEKARLEAEAKAQAEKTRLEAEAKAQAKKELLAHDHYEVETISARAELAKKLDGADESKLRSIKAKVKNFFSRIIEGYEEHVGEVTRTDVKKGRGR